MIGANNIDKAGTKSQQHPNHVEPVYHLKMVRGIPQNPTFNLESLEFLIDHFEVKESDVFVATYVKAGTTWTQQIIHLLLRNGYPGGFYSESVPWLEALSSDVLAPREAPTWSLDKVKAAPTPRYFKTHATPSQLPGAGISAGALLDAGCTPTAPRVIYVARNPKDTMVSLYHHAKSKPEFGFNGTFADFYGLFVAGQVENGSWFEHVLSWHQQYQKAPVGSYLWLQYEDMVKNPLQAVRTIAAFLNVIPAVQVGVPIEGDAEAVTVTPPRSNPLNSTTSKHDPTSASTCTAIAASVLPSQMTGSCSAGKDEAPDPLFKDPAAEEQVQVQESKEGKAEVLVEAILQRVVAHAGLQQMKNQASIGLNHIRRGGYGGWREYFSATMDEHFNKLYREKMRGSGLKFNFGPKRCDADSTGRSAGECGHDQEESLMEDEVY